MLASSGMCIAQDVKEGAYVLDPAFRHQAFPEGLNLAGWPRRHWVNGYLISYGINAQPNSPILQAFDEHANLTTSGTVWFPESGTLSIQSVSVNHNGTVYVSAASISSGGALADFIAALDDRGYISNTVRTSPYIAYRICPTPSNTVWTLGVDRHTIRSGGDDLMLREYSFAKGEIRATLDMSALNAGRVSSSSMFLACNDLMLGAFIDSARKWITLDFRTGKLTVRDTPALSSKSKVTGIALTPGGELVVSIYHPVDTTPVVGLFVLSNLSGLPLHWVAVRGAISAMTTRPSAVAELLGNDGNALVYVGGSFNGTVAFWANLRGPAHNSN